MFARRCCVCLIAGGMVFLLNSSNVTAEEPGTWVRPDGFQAPTISKGQYSFRAGLGLRGSERKWDEEGDGWWYPGTSEGRATADEWSLLSNLTFAPANDWVVMTGFSYAPSQESNESNALSIWDDVSNRTHRTENLDYGFSSHITVAFKPSSLMELYISGRYSGSKVKGDVKLRSEPPDFGSSEGKDQFKSYSIFAGINIAR